MKFAYLQKLTMVDFPGTISATVFTIGCNFRCPFCHNPELVVPPLAEGIYEEKDVLDFLKKRKGMLKGLCITGGEPTLHGKSLASFMEKVKSLGYKLKLDTNGSNPDMLNGYIEEGLVDYVAMDIKTSRQNYYRAIGLSEEEGRNMVKAVSESLDILMSSDIPFELRTTAVPTYVEEEDFYDIAQWIKGAPYYAIQRYHKDKVLDGSASPDDTYSREALEKFADIVKPHVGKVEVRW